MEQSSSDNAKAKQPSTRKPKQKPGLKRHRSSEDLPSELKSTQRQCISIFFEFVKKKSSAPSHAAAHSTPSATQSPQAEDTQRKPYRRLCSEPIGGSSACTVHRKESSTGVCRERLQPEDSAPVEEKEGIVRSKPIHCTATAARPCSLSLEHRRMPSNASSGKTTPAPDPPLFSPASVPELLETYPPARPHFARHCSSSSPFLPAFVTVGAVESQRHLCSAPASSLPNDPSAEFLSDAYGDPQSLRHSKAIAERLKYVGDQIQDWYGEQELDNALTSLITGQNPQIGRFLSILSNLRLSWQRVSWLFGIGYEMIEKLSANLGSGAHGHKLYEDERWPVFQSLWDFIVNNLARWIWANGGWGAFLKATEGMASTEYHTTFQRPRLWSLSESGSFVNEDGLTLQDADMEDESGSRSGSGTPSDFEGSVGLGSTDELLQTNSLPRLFTIPQTQQSDDLHDSGIISSTEQLPLSTHSSEHHLDAAPSSTSLPPSTLLTPDVLMPQTMLSSLPGGETAASETSHFDRNRSMSLPVRRRGARGDLPRRTSEKALDGLLYTVNISMSAALVFAAVSSLLNR